MKSIGGYFELESRSFGAYYSDGIALNTARNAFEYLLKVRKYSKVYLPYFTCEVMLEPLKKLEIDFQFYEIDKNLEPVFDYTAIMVQEGFLYTNYFGLKDRFINKLATNISNLIIDNAQSFFSAPLDKIDTIYSARKFFGVSDGAYLFCDKLLNEELELDLSFKRMSHLLRRADTNAEDGYVDFCMNDASLSNQSLKHMSHLTHKILNSIDYDQVKKRRVENFQYLHHFLKDKNLFQIEESHDQIPMVYPYWTKDITLRNKLTVNRIYCATYWPNVLEWCDKDSVEVQLTNELVHLPIDQRYDLADMKNILKYV